MSLAPGALLLLVASIVYALPASQHGSVNWQPCPQQNGSVPIQCGTLTVPLDYADPPSNKTLDLELVKVSAVKQPRRGSILFNPGGPGDSGRNLVAGDSGPAFLLATGGYHDLIGFDPRGTGFTIPYSCYDTQADREVATLLTPTLSNSSDSALGTEFSLKKALAESCFENAKDRGELVGTAFVARDMIRIAEALDDDGLLRYWGFSYVTILGATVAAMFPDKIDRLVLDGVENPHLYYAGRDIDGPTDSDAVLAGFFSGCIAAPDNCALAQDGRTAEELSSKVIQLIQNLKYDPIVAGTNLPTDLIDYSIVKGTLFSTLYNPVEWPGAAAALHALLANNVTAFFEAIASTPTDPTVFPTLGAEVLYGITCSETALKTDNLTALLPLIDEFYATSYISGGSLTSLVLTCPQWLFRAREVYGGDFQVKTKNPLPIIGNTYDPMTPLVSVRNASAGFEGSVLLQHNGYRHTSTAQPSLCTGKAIRDYFVDGILPAPGTICQPTVQLFGPNNATAVFEPLANLTKRAAVQTDDTELLAALVTLGKRRSQVGSSAFKGIRGKMPV